MTLLTWMPAGWTRVARGLAVAACVWAGTPLQAEGDEVAIKARILKIALEYIQWPPGTESNQGTREVLVLGTSTLAKEIPKAFGGGAGRIPTTIKVVTRMPPPSLLTCQVLVICDGEGEDLYRILALIKGRPILTVAETAGAAQQGVMLNLVTEGGRVVMETHLGSMRAAGLEMSSALLVKSRVVSR